MITAHGIRFAYQRAAVLENIEITAAPGEVVGLIGPNGSGKSTLLRTLYGALTAQSGAILIDDTPVTDMHAREVAIKVAVVVQEPGGEQLPFTVRDLVLLGRTPHLRSFERHTRADHDIVAHALQKVGASHLADRTFSELSGGEKQRVLIGRAIAQDAAHLLLDEPTNHLDIRYQHEILTLVRDLGIATIVVLHDLNLAARYCDRLVLLHAGTVAIEGRPTEVLTPRIVKDVYGISAERVDRDGIPQLIFTL